MQNCGVPQGLKIQTMPGESWSDFKHYEFTLEM